MPKEVSVVTTAAAQESADATFIADRDAWFAFAAALDVARAAPRTESTPPLDKP